MNEQYEGKYVENLASYDSEHAVIGSMLIDGECVRGVIEVLGPQDFHFEFPRIAFTAIIAVHAANKAVDVVTVSEEIEASGINVLPNLLEAAKGTPSSANVLAYADTVREMSDRRRLRHEFMMAAQAIADRTVPVSDTVETYSTRISSVERRREANVHRVADHINDEFVKPLDDRFNGLVDPMGWSMGVKDLDEQIMGMHDGDLVVVAGRPSMGKTAFINNIIAANLKRAKDNDAPVIDFSLEMSRGKRMVGLVGCMGRIPLASLKNPKEGMDGYWDNLTYPVTMMSGAPFYMEDGGHSIEDIEAKAEEVYQRHGKIGMILVDYLMLVTGGKNEGSDSPRLEVGERVKRLKAMAMKYGCRVVVLSQLSRRVEQRPNKRPMMSDLMESGDIEAAADIVVMLYRDEYYNHDNPDNKGIIELIVSKCREGQVGTVVAAAMLNMGLIADLAPQNLNSDH